MAPFAFLLSIEVLPFSLGDSEDADYQHSEFMEAECVQMNNQLIVAGFVFGHVCVWGMESKKLVRVSSFRVS